MTRLEFSRVTRRQALDRSRIDGTPRCEAIGTDYGLEAGKRCLAPLAKSFEVHHVKEAEYGGDSSLENALCLCRPCHRAVTKPFIQGLRKADRVRDKNSGAMKPTGRGFYRPPGTAFNWSRGRYVRAER